MGPLWRETKLKHAALDSAERSSKAETASAKRNEVFLLPQDGWRNGRAKNHEINTGNTK